MTQEEPNGLPLDGIWEYTFRLTSKWSFGSMTSPAAESELTSNPLSINNHGSLGTGIEVTDKPYGPHGYKENEKMKSQKCSVSHMLSVLSS